MAGVSDTTIVNLALSHLRKEDPVSNLYTETSAAARNMRRWYDAARQQFLSEFNWSFAKKRQTLATHSDGEPDEGDWAYRYQEPSDMLVARYLVPPGGTEDDAVPYERCVSTDGTMCLLTNLDDAVLVYTFDNTNPAMYSAHGRIAFSYLLAQYGAGVLTGKQTLVDKMAQAYYNMALVGAVTDGNQQVSREPRDADWIRGR